MEIGAEYIQRKFSEMEEKLARTHNLAQQAFNDVSAHEEICAERYGVIKEKLQVVPKIFDRIERLQRVANLFLGGLMLASTGFLGVMVAIIVYISKQP
jgi:hypothetical protein